MKKKWHWIVGLFIFLSLPALACGPFGGGDEEATAVTVVEPATDDEPTSKPAPTNPPPTSPPTVEAPTATSEPTPSNEAESDAPPALAESVLEISAIESLPFDSYRVAMLLMFIGSQAGGEEAAQTINADLAFSSEPPASGLVINFSGLDAGFGGDEMEMVQIEGVSYMVLPGMGCITTTGEDSLQDNPFTSMLAPDQFLENLEDARYEGEETINNIPVLHYSFDKSALVDANQSEFEEAEGHVYIAKDGGFLVRMVMDARGNIDFFTENVDQNGDLHLEINLTDVDEPVDISIPEACEAAAASNFPMLADATEISSFSGVVSYKTALPTEDVIVFYDDALAGEGWAKDEASSFVGGGSALIVYTREGESLNLTISPDQDGGGTLVVLINEME